MPAPSHQFSQHYAISGQCAVLVGWPAGTVSLPFVRPSLHFVGNSTVFRLHFTAFRWTFTHFCLLLESHRLSLPFPQAWHCISPEYIRAQLAESVLQPARCTKEITRATKEMLNPVSSL